jgi:predicted TIM-barrel fold metal-dependent hydrolase
MDAKVKINGMAHITGGGDWQWQLKGIADVKNIYTDFSGSVIDAPVIEETVRILGADRILFGTDGTLFAGIGKMLEGNISIEDKKKILAGGAYDRFIQKAKK